WAVDMAFVLHVPETPEDAGQEPSPYDEAEVHNSFHQLIQEQSQWVAAAGPESGLELQERVIDGGHQAVPGPEGAPVYSAATLRILANMPSRTIGRSRGAIISQYYNRTVQLRRRGSRPLLSTARPSLRLRDLELDPKALQEEEKRSLLVRELQGLTGAQRDHMLRRMPLSLAEKRCLREESQTLRRKQRGRQGRDGVWSCCSRLKYGCVLALHNLGLWLLSVLQALTPWHYALKRIGGQFGSSVLSYFLFLKTLLAFSPFSHCPFLALLLCLSHGSVPCVGGLFLPLKAGYFTHTVMYYGYYSNTTLNQQCAPRLDGNQCTPAKGGLPYNMPLAYLFTMGVAFFITCITLVYRYPPFPSSPMQGSIPAFLSSSLLTASRTFVVLSQGMDIQEPRVLAWVYENMGGVELTSYPGLSFISVSCSFFLSFIFWVFLGSLLFPTTCVLTLPSSASCRQVDAGQEVALLALPVVVSLINLVVPYMYRGLAALEQHESPVLEVYMAICRNLILKMVILGILCYHWLGRRVGALRGQCWEDFVGQELYRFMVMDFIFILVDTLFGELVWRLVSEKKLKRWQKPEFDIARNVLELIYGQTLTWLGVLFSPLLPAMQVLKLLLLFYIKKVRVLLLPPPAGREPGTYPHPLKAMGLAARATLGSVPCPWSQLTPYPGITVFARGVVQRPAAVSAPEPQEGLHWERPALGGAHPPLWCLDQVPCAVIYLNIQVVKGQRKVICLLKEQISNEGEDKVFLINKLHSVYERKEKSRCGATPCVSREGRW
uniref:Transmembrane channel-like protein n=1 Tax=Loxodonta africana TaxID=9785 RepID=G3U0A0_LOXAF